MNDMETPVEIEWERVSDTKTPAGIGRESVSDTKAPAEIGRESVSDTKTPAGIERESMRIIDAELSRRGIALSPDRAAIVKRVIHATADFDYAETLRFTPDAPSIGETVVRGGVIVTDTNMALSGISKSALRRLGASALCLMAQERIAQEARERRVTRATVCMERSLERIPNAILAIGNAPTALLRVAELIETGARPAFVIGVPVGFVNVVESKERIWDACGRCQIPAIVAMGRKGGSAVAAAICNALLYAAAGMSDPRKRETETQSERETPSK